MDQTLQNNPLSTPPTAPVAMSNSSVPAFSDGGATFTPLIPQPTAPVKSEGLSWKDFNWTSILLMLTATTALFINIRYNIQQGKAIKLINYDIQKQLAALQGQ